ncbi:MAG: hypothetical protein ACREGB_03650 [Candidatus Saccharimonadales bacterium]
MGRGRRAFKGPKTLWDKVNELDPRFATEVNSMADEALHKKIVDHTQLASEYEATKAKDDDLKSKQNAAREAAKTYSEPLKAIKLKNRLIIQTLKERGKM